MKRKALIVLIILLILSWVGNLVYFFNYRLDKPVVLSQYTDYLIYPNQSAYFELYYLTNQGSKVNIERIGQPDNLFFPAQIQNAQVNTYNPYVLKRALVIVNSSNIDSITEKEDLKLEQLSVYFSDGSMQKVDIGEIHFRNKREAITESAFRSVASGSFNNDHGFHLLTAEEPVTIESIEYPFKDRLGDAFQVSATLSTISWTEQQESIEGPNRINMDIDEKSLLETIPFPIRLEKGNALRVAYQFRFDKEIDLRKYDFYKLKMKINFVTDEGQKETTEVEMHNTPEFQKEDILKLMKERREE